MSNLPATIKPATATPATSKPSALRAMASRLKVDEDKMLATLKGTVFAAAKSNEELLALVVVANEYDLNPFLKEIYAFPAKGGGIVPIVSVDGWNKMLIRQPDFDGLEFEFTDDQEGKPYSCTATVHIKNRSHAVKITEYLSECYRNTEPWNNMPRRMLRNRTLCQVSRMAFGFSGVSNEDEAATYIDITPAPAAALPPSEPPPKLVALPESAKVTEQSKVESLYLNAGHTFADAVKVLEQSNLYPDAGSLTDISELPKDVAKRILLAEKGFLKMLADLKGQAV